jgi:Na+/H+-dicarboxylate symporter
VVTALDKMSHIILKMVNYVMNFALNRSFELLQVFLPLGIFKNLAITYFKFFGSFLIGISSLWVVLILVGYIFLKSRMTVLLKRIVSPLIIAWNNK